MSRGLLALALILLASPCYAKEDYSAFYIGFVLTAIPFFFILSAALYWAGEKESGGRQKACRAFLYPCLCLACFPVLLVLFFAGTNDIDASSAALAAIPIVFGAILGSTASLPIYIAVRATQKKLAAKKRPSAP